MTSAMFRPMDHRSCDLTDFTLVQPELVENILSHLETGKSPGPDGITALM